MKLVINDCFGGGFGLSHEAIMEYARRSGFDLFVYVTDRDMRKIKPYDPAKMPRQGFVIYLKKPVRDDGKYDDADYFLTHDIKRDDPNLIAIVEVLGEAANGDHAKLRIVEIPDGVQWEISECNGREIVEEQHRSWY